MTKRICVLSGKGGVGKTTVSYNIALELLKLNYTVGLLDCDVSCPNVPNVANLPSDAEMQIRNERIQPYDHHGLKIVSIDFSIPKDAPVLWNGSQKRDAVEQLLKLSEWGEELDYLIVDCPASTGDELVPVLNDECTGAIIVTNPDPMASKIAIRAKEVLLEYGVPYLGLIMNKAYIPCEQCGHENLIPLSVVFEKQEIIASFPYQHQILENNILPGFDLVIKKILTRIQKAKFRPPKMKHTMRIKSHLMKVTLDMLAKR